MYQTDMDKTPMPVEFRGNTREWFGIWIVNLVLSILTVGIYSAWAKVRHQKYFFQNTYVGGRNFDYHATGKQILIGRIIVVVGLVAFTVLSAIPLFAIIGFIALLFVIPWLVVKSLMFTARVSSWSNVRFGFLGTYGGAAKAFILIPILCAIPLYLAMPFAERARRRYIVNNHRLGKARFVFDAPISRFYLAAILAIAWVVVSAMVLIGIAAVSGMFDGMVANLDQAANNDLKNEPQDLEAEIMPFLIIYPLMFLVFAPATALYYALARNIVFNNTTLDNVHAFRSTVPPMIYVWIVMTNAVAIILSLGLLLPWAQIRKARFMAKHTVFLAGGSLDEFIGDIQDDQSAVGDAYSDIEGLGLDIGI